jgi:hypothetical protein
VALLRISIRFMGDALGKIEQDAAVRGERIRPQLTNAASLACHEHATLHRCAVRAAGFSTPIMFAAAPSAVRGRFQVGRSSAI